MVDGENLHGERELAQRKASHKRAEFVRGVIADGDRVSCVPHSACHDH